MSRIIIDRLICSRLNSKNGIKLSFDKPLSNPLRLNITRPAVLRQYFGKVVESSVIEDNKSMRYTYGSGSGASSVGMHPLNYVTRPLYFKMEAMIDKIYSLLKQNQDTLNLSSVNLDKKINYCTVLVYYTGEGLKTK